MRTSKEIGAELAQKLGEAENFYKSKTDATTGRFDDSGDNLKAFDDRHAEINKLGTELQEAKAFEAKAHGLASMREQYAQPANDLPYGANNGGQPEYKSLGTLITENAAIKSWAEAGFPSLKGTSLKFEVKDVSPETLYQDAIKTTMTTAAGWAPFVPRIPRIELTPMRRPMVQDLIPQDNTTASAVKYMEETTNTNNAAPRAEGVTKPESALAFTERTVNMTKVATTLPVTDEQLEDVPTLRAYIDRRLVQHVAVAEEYELMNGTASSPSNFYGFMTKPSTSTQAQGTDPIPTAVLKAMTKVRYTASLNVMNAEPDAVIFHPTDFEKYITYQASTGQYIFGMGMQGAPTADPIHVLWGMRVVVTPVISQGTALVGDFANFSHISRRLGITVDVGYSGTDFIDNITRLRAESRLALEIYRASAYCKITGIT